MKLESIETLHEGTHTTLYGLNYINRDGKKKHYTKISRNPNMTEETIDGRPNAITILIFSEDHSKILLNKEFRMAVNKTIINFPGGLIDPGEDAETAGRREVIEESGYTLKDFTLLPATYSSAGITDEKVHFAIATVDKKKFEPTPSPNEEITPVWVTKDEVRALREEYDFSSRSGLITYLWVNNLLNL